jgi:predicted DNA-binding ribbon-helix-helix protein
VEYCRQSSGAEYGMKNVTITLEEPTLDWLRKQAAERKISLSRLIGEVLATHQGRDEKYAAAMRQFFSVLPRVLDEAGRPYPKRDELYDRPRLR